MCQAKLSSNTRQGSNAALIPPPQGREARREDGAVGISQSHSGSSRKALMGGSPRARARGEGPFVQQDGMDASLAFPVSRRRETRAVPLSGQDRD